MQILISGGANSGKSSLAEQLAVAQSFHPRYYFATMQVWDAECARRIERHRQQRAGKDFQTVEVPANLLETISTLPQGGCGLLECVSNLLSNEQFGGSQEDPVTAILDGMAALQKKLDTVVIVTNEVFTDRVPNDIAMQVVGVGFIIGVIQDSVETALNSSSDLLLSASAEFRQWRKEGKEIRF